MDERPSFFSSGGHRYYVLKDLKDYKHTWAEFTSWQSSADFDARVQGAHELLAV